LGIPGNLDEQGADHLDTEDDIKALVGKCSDLDLRITKIEIYFKVTLAVAAIFGIGAGVGATVLSGAANRITDLTKRVDDADTRFTGKTGEFEAAKNVQLKDFEVQSRQTAKRVVESEVEQKLGKFSGSITKLENKTWRMQCDVKDDTSELMIYPSKKIAIPEDYPHRSEYEVTGGSCSVPGSEDEGNLKRPAFGANPPITVSKPVKGADGRYDGWFCKGGDLPNLNIYFRITARVIFCRSVPR
jgi:uncharacterized cupredoxin-like copper-binding protein